MELHSKAMLTYLSSRCLDPLRGDRLMLVQQSHTQDLTPQQAAQQRRLMESFADVASSEGAGGTPCLTLDSPFQHARCWRRVPWAHGACERRGVCARAGHHLPPSDRLVLSDDGAGRELRELLQVRREEDPALTSRRGLWGRGG